MYQISTSPDKILTTEYDAAQKISKYDISVYILHSKHIAWYSRYVRLANSAVTKCNYIKSVLYLLAPRDKQ